MNNSDNVRKKVIILGGGVAGLSAAHELKERGFNVDIYEARNIPGGKARSIRYKPDAKWDRGLPAEHGFRFFPGFYRHITHTMKRIPAARGKVYQSLTHTTQGSLARFDAASVLLPTRFPQSPKELKTALSFLGEAIPVPDHEFQFWLTRVWQILTSCEARRADEYERVSWWDFIGAQSRSEAYKKYLGNLTRTLVAAVPQRASAKTNGDILVQLLLDMIKPDSSSDRVLSGPTNEVWIYPWLTHLLTKRAGHGDVRYFVRTAARAINLSKGRVDNVDIEPLDGCAQVLECGRDGISKTAPAPDTETFRAGADYYVCAVPVECMTPFIKHKNGQWTKLAKSAPTLKLLPLLAESTEWMNGIVYYLKEDVPVVHGHTIYVDAPWALTSISQKQFWPNVDLADYGDGQVRGVLSVDVSNWKDAPGNQTGKAAYRCTPEEVRDEVWADIKQSFRHDAGVELGDWHDWFLETSVNDMECTNLTADNPDGMANHYQLKNDEPLLVNEVDTWRLRPNAVTEVDNLFLAADYVRTYTDLATMESANEAARRAVNGILDRQRYTGSRCRVWRLSLPFFLEPLRRYDRWRYDRGLGWRGSLPWGLRMTLFLRQLGGRRNQ